MTHSSLCDDGGWVHLWTAAEATANGGGCFTETTTAVVDDDYEDEGEEEVAMRRAASQKDRSLAGSIQLKTGAL